MDLLLELARGQKVDLAKISILALVDQYILVIEGARRVRLLVRGDERGGEAAGGNRLSVVSVSTGRPLSLLLIIKITKTASGGRSGGRKPGPEPGGAGFAWRSHSRLVALLLRPHTLIAPVHSCQARTFSSRP